MDLHSLHMQLKIVIVVLSSATSIVAVAAQDRSGCGDRCGNVTIPFPFGVEGCNLTSAFLITCNNSTNPPVPYLRNSKFKVTNISLDGRLTILRSVARNCYDHQGVPQVGPQLQGFTLSDFTISSSYNKFTVIGCDSYAYIRGFRAPQGQRKLLNSGCMSVCTDIDFVEEKSCSGSGCCQIGFPDGLLSTNVTAYSFNSNHTSVWAFNPCTYAFIVEDGQFEFDINYLKDIPLNKEFPVVLEWTIDDSELGNICKDNAKISDPLENISVYRCECEKGYHGNPYLGCEDDNECRSEEFNSCTHPHLCRDIPGNYTCSCPEGYHGDGRKDGEGCTRNQLPVITIFLCVGIGFVGLVVASSWLYLISRKRKLIKLKEKFFQQNGGAILREKLSKQEAGTSFAAKIFTAEELKKATNNYDESTIIGKGGFGIVHKGILTDNKLVAIKKSITVDPNQIDQFINEVVVLSQINHRNVVKLLGCCLETQVPLLVYEFISNGTLFDYIHHENNETALSWETRLRIAGETAGALSYLHSEASIPIIHRDVKATNILLDATYTAKVSDFGASRLVPVDETQLSTMVQGTWGYLDPEYLRTNQLTEKSDVYSFGVVLVELLTSLKALSFDRPEEERSLAMHFLSSLQKGDLFGIVDSRIVNEKNKEHIEQVAKLAVRCLTLKGEERPSMKEVAIELEGLRVTEVHPWLQVNQEETEYLLNIELSNDFGYGDVSSASAGYDSMNNNAMLSVGDSIGR